ncbi:MAG: DUF4062 domain-containing protein [Acidobacteria bacterium]|nr:DUF4062 domain-containing protein [Acidobacteriota bacterium]
MYRVFQQNDQRETLLIDRLAAAEVPDEATIREWARDKRAFISSVMAELSEERAAAAAAVRSVGAQPVMFEDFGGRDADPFNAYMGEVETSHIYIGILGRTYGQPLSTRFSATHTEYRHAEHHGLRIAGWALDTKHREGPQQAFLDEIRTFHVVPSFQSPDNLRRQVHDRLRGIAAEDLSPWVKLGSIVFRAGQVVHDRNEIEVSARIQTDDVASALEAMAPDDYGRGQASRFTWAGRCRSVRVTNVRSTTTTARSTLTDLRLHVVDDQTSHPFEMSVDGFTADDLTDAALRVALFRAPNPLAQQHMGFMVETRDPLEPLRDAGVPDEIVRSLAELMIVEELVGSGRAARVADFKLGASVSGLRRLEFSWAPPRRYDNELYRESRPVCGSVRL